MAKTKAQIAAEMAYQAGQAAQRDHLTDDVNPFEPGTDEYQAWLDGRHAEKLGEQWHPNGFLHRQAIAERGAK